MVRVVGCAIDRVCVEGMQNQKKRLILSAKCANRIEGQKSNE